MKMQNIAKKITLVNLDEMEILPASKTEKRAYNKFRARVFSHKNYSKVQEMLVRLESSDEIFKIRMGENVSNRRGGENFILNPNTNELDINISNYADFKLGYGAWNHEAFMERRAINTQMTHPSYKSTTKEYKINAIKYENKFK